MADPVDDEVDELLNRFLGDPKIRASLDAYLEWERRGAVGPGVSHAEVGRHLGLFGDVAVSKTAKRKRDATG